MSARVDELRATRRDQILAAAAGCFLATGFDGTGIAAIAGAAGLSVGGVYRHFPGKEDIVATLVERDLAAQLARLSSAVADRTDDDFDGRVAAVVRALLTAQLPDRDSASLGVEFCAAATRSPRIAVLLTKHADSVEATVRAALPGRRAAAGAELLAVLLDGLMIRIAVAGASPETLEQTADEITALLVLTLKE